MNTNFSEERHDFRVGCPVHPSIDEVYAHIDALDPTLYEKTRNYLDGAVTWLSPYITHGVINTSIVAERILAKHAPDACFRLLYELAWREYFHRNWQEHGDDIFSDMRGSQSGVESRSLPAAITASNTGVEVLDHGLKALQSRGWMHNHMRMWVAGVVCNVAHTHWEIPARWMHYYLLDGDLASNTLSWQWIAGTFSNKQYIANQENLNKYSRTTQRNTWLDVSYETLANMPTPEILQLRNDELGLTQNAPGIQVPQALASKVGLRSMWNLNPDWVKQSDDLKDILFIEREHIAAWPMAKHRWAFIQHWADQLGAEIWLGSVDELNRLESTGTKFIREEYPACSHWPGTVTERAFHFPLPSEPYKSFSQFWKMIR